LTKDSICGKIALFIFCLRINEHRIAPLSYFIIAQVYLICQLKIEKNDEKFFKL